MGSKRTLEERIAEKDERMQRAMEKAKQYEAQKKRLEKEQRAANEKARTKRLIEIGASVESVLGRAFGEGDIIRLMNFLKAQETNGKYFSRAMNKAVSKPQEKVTEGAE